MMSYMPFNRDVMVHNVQQLIDQKGMKASMCDSPSRRRESAKEGLYQEKEGKNVDYADRINDQEEIKVFTDMLFSSKYGVTGSKMNYEQYDKINKQHTSEMFYSLMAILHEKLPCSMNYFRMRRKFKDAQDDDGQKSPVRTIASPKII